jgi:hypothetical protein
MADARATRLILIGGVGTQSPSMAAAKDLYRGSLFARRRAHAEASGRPWFVLSDRWGLVHPDELIAPTGFSMTEHSLMYLRAWGRLVAEQLAIALPLERAALVEVHASPDCFDSIRRPLEYLELIVVSGVVDGAHAEARAG